MYNTFLNGKNQTIDELITTVIYLQTLTCY